MSEKSYFEIEFAVLFLDQDHELTPTGFSNPATRYYKANPDVVIIPVAALEPGEALQAITDHLFAEVNIPHHTDQSIYCFICHLFGIPNSQPAIMEMLALQKLAPQIYDDFGTFGAAGDSVPDAAPLQDDEGDTLAQEVCPACGAHIYAGDDDRLHCIQCDWTGNNWLSDDDDDDEPTAPYGAVYDDDWYDDDLPGFPWGVVDPEDIYGEKEEGD